MFDKLIQKVILTQVKGQAKKLAEQGVVTLDKLDLGITADRIVAVAETLLKKKGIVLPSFIADVIEKNLDAILDRVRDEAVKLITLKLIDGLLK